MTGHDARSGGGSTTDCGLRMKNGGRQDASGRQRPHPPIALMPRSGCTKSGLVDQVPRAPCAAPPRAAAPRSRRRSRRRACAVAQVVLAVREQARADLAVGGEPDAVAVAAERARHRGDDAHAARRRRGSGTCAPARWDRRPSLELERELGARAAPGSRPPARACRAIPLVLEVERHPLDEAQLVAFVARPARQRHGLVVVEAAHQHRVHLDRARSPRARAAARPASTSASRSRRAMRVEALARRACRG